MYLLSSYIKKKIPKERIKMYKLSVKKLIRLLETKQLKSSDTTSIWKMCICQTDKWTIVNQISEKHHHDHPLVMTIDTIG